MEKKNVHLTNQELAAKFKNNFELVNYAISLAENMIKSGRDSRVKSDVQNRAMLILEEIMQGKDIFDIIPEKAPEVSREAAPESKTRYGSDDKHDRHDRHDKYEKHDRHDKHEKSERPHKQRVALAEIDE